MRDSDDVWCEPLKETVMVVARAGEAVRDQVTVEVSCEAMGTKVFVAARVREKDVECDASDCESVSVHSLILSVLLPMQDASLSEHSDPFM